MKLQLPSLKEKWSWKGIVSGNLYNWFDDADKSWFYNSVYWRMTKLKLQPHENFFK